MELFKRIGLAQINMHVGNFEANTEKIIRYIQAAKLKKKSIVVFPELAVCGYPARDFLEFSDFIDSCNKVVDEILEHTEDIYVILGIPTRNDVGRGKPLYNSAMVLHNKKIISRINKTLLPNYDVFDEYRYFEPNDIFECIDIEGVKVGITICEDIWNTDEVPTYKVSPVEELKKQGAELIINIAASPFHALQHEERLKVIKSNIETYQIPFVYCNYIGAQTELVFDGGSMFVNSKGEIKNSIKFFEEDLIEFDDNPKQIKSSQIERCYQALKLGISDYFNKLGFKKAVVGLSGGIDSAVTYALACEALGSKNVLGVLMPSQYSSDHSIKDAENLVKNYNGEKELLDIHSVYESLTKKLDSVFNGLPFNIAEENLQARIRGVLLMAISNKFGNILLNTSNKSEAAVGYGTLYGDMCGGLAVLGDVYKVDVFELAKFINRNEEKIPVNSIVKPPSAELRPDQKDSDSLPDYEVLDTVLKLYIEGREGPNQIIKRGFDSNLVKRILRMVNLNEHKRFQTPPILRISKKAFGMGRRMPIVARYLT